MEMLIPNTGEVREILTILDSGSGINIINDQLVSDWEIPTLDTTTNIIFPNVEEKSSLSTQETCITIRLPNESGEIIEKSQNLRFTLSKNIPYGCLLGIHTLFPAFRVIYG